MERVERSEDFRHLVHLLHAHTVQSGGGSKAEDFNHQFSECSSHM